MTTTKTPSVREGGTLPLSADRWCYNCESSHIQQAGVRGTDLIVVFADGDTFLYSAGAKHFWPMLQAKSRGAYFNKEVREEWKDPGTYQNLGNIRQITA